MMKSNQYKIQEGHNIPYYEETQKRTFIQMIRKIKNTILLLLAYGCPNNRLRVWMHRKRGVHIGKHVYIGMFCFIDNLYPNFIYFEDNVSVNAGSMILAHFDPMKRFSNILPAMVKPILVKNGAIVAVRSVILPGVSIGENAIVSAGTVVDKDVKPYTLVKGNPMKEMMEYELLMNNNDTD